MKKKINTFLTQKKFWYRKSAYLNNLPISMNKLIEKLNVEFLKLNYKGRFNYVIGKYQIDLNSRII